MKVKGPKTYLIQRKVKYKGIHWPKEHFPQQKEKVEELSTNNSLRKCGKK